MPAPPPVTLTFRNVMWSVEVKRPKDDPNPGKGKTKVKKIIKGVTGFIEVRLRLRCAVAVADAILSTGT